MHMHWHIQLFCEHGNLRQRRIVDRVGRVRGEGGMHEWVFAIAIMDCLAFAQVLAGVLRPGRRKSNHNHADHRADTKLGSRRRRLIREQVHVVEAGGAPAQHLVSREASAVTHERRVNHARFSRPNLILQPAQQRQIVRHAAKQTHRRVGMGVNEPGQHRMVAAVDFAVGGHVLAPLGARHNRDDPSVCETDTVRREHGCAHFDGDDPARVDDLFDIEHDITYTVGVLTLPYRPFLRLAEGRW